MKTFKPTINDINRTAKQYDKSISKARKIAELRNMNEYLRRGGETTSVLIALTDMMIEDLC